MINTIFYWMEIFLNLIFYIIFLDIIISWLNVFWLKIRIKFIRDIINPIYKTIREYLPTKFSFLDLTPLYAIFILMILNHILYYLQNNII